MALILCIYLFFFDLMTFNFWQCFDDMGWFLSWRSGIGNYYPGLLLVALSIQYIHESLT